jgi:hypothetical protein
LDLLFRRIVDRCETKEEKAKLVLGESFFFSTMVKHSAQEEAIASGKGTASIDLFSPTTFCHLVLLFF